MFMPSGVAAASAVSPVEIVGGTISDVDGTGGTATVACQFRTDGNEYHFEGGSQVLVNQWLLAGAIADYEIGYNSHSGDVPAGSAVNTWLDLASQQDWSFSQAGVGTLNCSGTLEVRLKVSGFIVARAVMTLNAVVTI